MSKYKRGELIISLSELADWMEDGGMVYIRHKVYHPGWVTSMTMRTLDIAIKQNQVWKAIPKSKNISVDFDNRDVFVVEDTDQYRNVIITPGEFSRSVQCVTACNGMKNPVRDIAKIKSDRAWLSDALNDIAKQKKLIECDDGEGDVEYGYDMIIDVARNALRKIMEETNDSKRDH